MVLDQIPAEILVHIGTCMDSEKDLGCLVLTSRYIYQTLNRTLYNLNLRHRHPQQSCVTWAAKNNSLATIKRAQGYGANLDGFDMQAEPKVKKKWFAKTKESPRRIYSPLHVAVLKGFHDITQYLLDNGVTVDIPSVGLCNCRTLLFNPLGPGWFPLHTALCHAREGNVSAEILIRHGARREAERCRGLGSRAVRLRPNLAKLVAGLGGLRNGNIDETGLDPLHGTAVDAMDEMVKLIVERPETGITARDLGENITVVHCDVSHRTVTIIRLLLVTPGVEVETAADSRRWNTAYNAAMGTDDGFVGQIIALLVRGGADVNHPGCAGMTPLYAAASRRIHYNWPNFLAVEALLAHGANPFLYKENRNHWSIFHQLLRQAPHVSEVVRPRRAVLRKLIEMGVDFDTRSYTRAVDTGLDYESDGTPLFFAAAIAQDPECCEILLKAGARPDTAVFNREKSEMSEQSFLSGVFRHMSSAEGRWQSLLLSSAGGVLAVLLRYGSRLEDVNGEESPLQFACRFPEIGRHYALLDFLVEHATDKNISIEYLEMLITEYRCSSRRSVGAIAGHFDAVVCKLQSLLERAYPDGQMDCADEGRNRAW